MLLFLFLSVIGLADGIEMLFQPLFTGDIRKQPHPANGSEKHVHIGESYEAPNLIARQSRLFFKQLRMCTKTIEH